MIGSFKNDKYFAISAAKAKRWGKMIAGNDHARVVYEQVSHMAEGVKRVCGTDSRLYLEMVSLKEKSRAVLEYRDELNGFQGGDEMMYLGLACVGMAQAIVTVVAGYEAAVAYNECA